MYRLDGRTALVTGAGSGIGEAIARCLAIAGAEVIVADLRREEAARVAQTIRENGGKAVSEQLDVGDGEVCRSLVDRILKEREAGCHVLVNNAGIGHVGTVLTTELADIERLMRVNVHGVFHLCKAMLPHMIARGSGSIVNLASIGGVIALRERFAYCTTKFAVVGMTKCLALDHVKSGVRVNCICPARVETPWIRQRIAEYPDPEAAYRQMSESQPVGRMAKPEEIAALALYLAADESAFVTGSAFPIDGGMTMGI